MEATKAKWREDEIMRVRGWEGGGRRAYIPLYLDIEKEESKEGGSIGRREVGGINGGRMRPAQRYSSHAFACCKEERAKVVLRAYISWQSKRGRDLFNSASAALIIV